MTTFPMDFAAVLASPVELHPLATDAATGESTDLRPFIGTPAELRLALRASAALPLLAGPPVEFAGRRFYDAGVSESIPYRTALAQGATHLLILRSRRDPRPAAGRPPPVPLGPRCSPAPHSAARPRPCALPSWPASPAWPPTTCSWPSTKRTQHTGPPCSPSALAPDSPAVSRLATEGTLLQAALESGRAAALAVLSSA